MVDQEQKALNEQAEKIVIDVEGRMMQICATLMKGDRVELIPTRDGVNVMEIKRKKIK